MITLEKKETAKERILQVASDLFYREGIRAVGIDRIIAESGVAKASFYRSFATKDDLVVAFLELRRQRVMDRIIEARSLYPGEPIKQLQHLFRKLGERMQEPDFRGCPFMNTAVEFPDETHPGRRMAVGSRQEGWRVILEIAREAGAKDPVKLAAQLEMLYSGATMMACMHRSRYDVESFYDSAMLLIREQVSTFA